MHTLATQGINRGMSLEAIAALPGHRTMTMTMTYAWIADRTVADEYFAVSEKVEALYQQPNPLPPNPKVRTCAGSAPKPPAASSATATAHGPRSSAAATKPSAKPAASFTPTIAFRDILQNQHDSAARHGHEHRQNVYVKILTGLDDAAS